MTGEIRKELKSHVQDQQKARMERFRQVMRESVSDLATSKSGLNILRFLFKESGFADRGMVLMGPNRPSEQGMVWNLARRDFYIDIRQFMTPEVIKLVELEMPNEENKYAGPESESKPESKS